MSGPDTGGGDGDALLPNPEAMRRLGYRAVDHIVDRWAGLEADRPWQGTSRAVAEARLDGPPSEDGGDVEALMDWAVREVFPLAGRIDHPRFMGFVPSGPGWPAVLADILVSGHNVFQGTWLESAGPSQIELTVLEWFRGWLGMPEGAGGILTTGGSVANLLAVVAARDLAGAPEGGVIYLSEQGHSSLERAARVAGFPMERVRKLSTGTDRRLPVDGVAAAVAQDRERGLHPLLICANGGATSTGVVDPLPGLAALARQEGVRLHVDAAYGGFAVLTAEGRAALEGIGQADTVTLDPHKWFFQTYECGCLMARDPGELERVFRVSAAYLQDTHLQEREVNFGDRGIQLTRAFRALGIWLTVQSAGRRRLAEAIEAGIELGAKAGAWIEAHPELELLHPACLGIVCFRYRPVGGDGGRYGAARRGSDDGWEGREGRKEDPWSEEGLETLNREVQDRMLQGGHAMMSSTRLDHRYSLRFCILNHRSRWEHVESALEQVVREGRALS
ncbi:MAG: aminotransferase class I/II-fold pyridoxal phosphate-dependent enzyme [Gemmatimonadales bacterium]|nr:MAG: aminotransferase class I/II-fold pyridoxal phosphate-dependent enzyme [Gemmatimonadales bacterium]